MTMSVQLSIDSPIGGLDIYQNGYSIMAGYAPTSPGANDETVIESIDLLITGSSESDLQSKIRAISNRLEIAKTDAVYSPTNLTIKMSSGDSYKYQARIYGGRVVPNSTLDRTWSSYQARVTVLIERSPFWEHTTWLAVPLTNTNGTDNTSGLNIYNCNDGVGASPNDRANYCTIAGTSIVGDMPAPIKLQMQPSTTINGVYIGSYTDLYADGGPHAWHWEAESMTHPGTAISGTSFSNGTCVNVGLSTSWAGIGTAVMAMDHYRGSYFRFFTTTSSTGTAPAGTWLKLSLYSSVGYMAETPATYCSGRRLLDLGCMRLPPGAGTLASPTTMLLDLYAYNASGGTINIDAVYAMGVDSYAEVGRDDTNNIGDTMQMIEQWGLDRQSYVEAKADSTGQYYYWNVQSGPGVYVTPGASNRLIFLQRNGNSINIASYLTVKCWYKPRRRTL